MLQAAPSGLAPFAAAYDRIAERTIAPGWPARASARLGARLLDGRLIAGADPAGSTVLAARACRLTSAAYRDNLADALARLLQSTTKPAHRAWVLSNRRAVEHQADELRSFAELLRSPAPLYARGIAMLARLLSDGTGPAYVGPPEALARRLGEIGVALNG